MGIVFEAQELELERRLALKVMLPTIINNKQSYQRFQREGKLLSALSHKNILTFYHFGFHNGENPYIAMELLDGIILSELIAKEGRIAPERCIAIALQICDALTYLHEHDVVHRDLKSSNIMLVNSPEPDFVKLLDFGLAKCICQDGVISEHLTATGSFIGSVNYMSPEQARGQAADARSDIYSLACVIFEMLSAELPFYAESPAAILQKHANETLRRFGQIDRSLRLPDGLEAIIRKCMAKDPNARYQSAAALKKDLADVRAGHGQWLTEGLERQERSPSSLLYFVVAGLFLLASIMGLAYFQSDSGRRQYDLLSLKYRPAEAFESLLNQADTLSKKGRYAEAINLLEQVSVLVDSPTVVSELTLLKIDCSLARLNKQIGNGRRSRKYIEKVLLKACHFLKEHESLSDPYKQICIDCAQMLAQCDPKPLPPKETLECVAGLATYAQNNGIEDLFIPLKNYLIQDNISRGIYSVAVTHESQVGAYYLALGRYYKTEQHLHNAAKYLRRCFSSPMYERARINNLFCSTYLGCGDGIRASEYFRKAEQSIAAFAAADSSVLLAYDRDHREEQLAMLSYDLAAQSDRLRNEDSSKYWRKYLSYPAKETKNRRPAVAALVDALAARGRFAEALKVIDAEIATDKQDAAADYQIRSRIYTRMHNGSADFSDYKSSLRVLLKQSSRADKDNSSWQTNAVSYLNASYLVDEQELQKYLKDLLEISLNKDREPGFYEAVEMVLACSYLRDYCRSAQNEFLEAARALIEKQSSEKMLSQIVLLPQQGVFLEKINERAAARLRFCSTTFLCENMAERILKDLREGKPVRIEDISTVSDGYHLSSAALKPRKFALAALPLAKEDRLRWYLLYFLARTYRVEGDKESALNYMQQALEIQEKAATEIDLAQRQYTVIDIGRLRQWQKRPALAIPVLKRFLSSTATENIPQNQLDYYQAQVIAQLCIASYETKDYAQVRANISSLLKMMKEGSWTPFAAGVAAASSLARIIDSGVVVDQDQLLQARTSIEQMRKERTRFNAKDSMELARALALVHSSLRNYAAAIAVCRNELESAMLIKESLELITLRSQCALEQELGVNIVLAGDVKAGRTQIALAQKHLNDVHTNFNFPADQLKESFGDRLRVINRN